MSKLSVGALPNSNDFCLFLDLIVEDVDRSGGSVRRFSGSLSGRCFGTVMGSFSFSRG